MFYPLGLARHGPCCRRNNDKAKAKDRPATIVGPWLLTLQQGAIQRMAVQRIDLCQFWTQGLSGPRK
jgi:hypothetical protein